MHLDHDLVIVHDPQPLPLIAFVRKRGPWVWRCHVELSTANAGLWAYLAPFIERYDAVVLSMPEYAQKLTTPQRFIMPAVYPFSTTNKRLSEAEIAERLDHSGIPTDFAARRPDFAFRQMEGSAGVIRAFNIARKEVDATLVLVGNGRVRRPRGPGGLRIAVRVQRGADPDPLGAGFRAGERATKTCCRRAAEIDPGRFRINGDESDVERSRGDRRPGRRYPSSN